jgi:hypothetical protein
MDRKGFMGYGETGAKKGRHGCVVKPFRGHMMDGDAPSHKATTTEVQVQNLLAGGRRTLPTAVRDRISSRPVCGPLSGRSPFV